MDDVSKIATMLEWLEPKNVKSLRGSIGLTGYYWKFINGYGIIADPLTNLLKKNSFSWSSEANRAFGEIK